MKHALISAICVAIVFIYSFFTMSYINNFCNSINEVLPYAADYNINTDAIVKIYDEHKNILTFILNRDHTNELENIIINLDKAVKYNDKQNTAINISLLKSALDSMIKSNSFTI